MPEDATRLTPRRAVGWAAIGGLIVAAVALYFAYGRELPPLTAEPPADTTTLR
jgi:hypothetical protein